MAGHRSPADDQSAIVVGTSGSGRNEFDSIILRAIRSGFF